MFYGGYAKNPTKEVNGKKVLIEPTIEEIITLLIDQKSDTQITAQEKSSSTRAFGAKGKKESSKASKVKDSSSKTSTAKPTRYCDTCFSNRHSTSHCWYTHPEKQSEEFKAKYPNAEAVKKALEEVQKNNKEWDKTHNIKSFVAVAKISTTGEKDPAWYLDSACSAHATYDLKDYICYDHRGR
ncbi:hypothetical protein MMC22_010300 [Lobaria immixta]|nr:hypothetical protein [Lobaria immixta]